MSRNSYFKDYMTKYRAPNKKYKYCSHCGLKLPKYKKRFCCKSHREAFYKENDVLHTKMLKNNTIQVRVPDECEECGGPVIVDGDDVVCKKCGLVY